jgi:hypothetical protein
MPSWPPSRPRDYVEGTKATWTEYDDGLANRVEISGESLKLVVEDPDSVGTYDPGRTIQLNLRGVLDEAVVTGQPFALATELLSRLKLWSSPTYLITVQLPLSWEGAISIGDYIHLTDWLVPKGDGSRGFSGIVQIVGITPAITFGAEPAKITVEFLHYDRTGSAGFAPAARASSLSGSTFQCAARFIKPTGTSTDWIDYTGSNSAGGTDAAAAFRVGEKVALREVDSTTPLVETGLTITAISGASITLSPVPAGAWAGKTIDLVYDAYGTTGLAQHQKDYCWIANNSGFIAALDPAKVWAP